VKEVVKQSMRRKPWKISPKSRIVIWGEGGECEKEGRAEGYLARLLIPRDRKEVERIGMAPAANRVTKRKRVREQREQVTLTGSSSVRDWKRKNRKKKTKKQTGARGLGRKREDTRES
jgi:hypothetical protein